MCDSGLPPFVSGGMRYYYVDARLVLSALDAILSGDVRPSLASPIRAMRFGIGEYLKRWEKGQTMALASVKRLNEHFRTLDRDWDANREIESIESDVPFIPLSEWEIETIGTERLESPTVLA